MRRLILMLALAAALLAALTADAAAAARPPVSIGVAPSKIQANLIPGQLYKTDLDIFNKGATPVTLDVYLQDYTVSAASAVAFKPAGSLAQSAAPWSTLSTRVLHMPAHSHRRVLLRVDVPATAAIGTHTLAVVFRSRQIKSDGNLRYQPAVASLMAAGVQNPDGSGLVLRGRGRHQVGVGAVDQPAGRVELERPSRRDRGLAVPSHGGRARAGSQHGQHLLQHHQGRHHVQHEVRGRVAGHQRGGAHVHDPAQLGADAGHALEGRAVPGQGRRTRRASTTTTRRTCRSPRRRF